MKVSFCGIYMDINDINYFQADSSMIYYDLLQYNKIYYYISRIYHAITSLQYRESGWMGLEWWFLRVELRIGRRNWLNQQWYSALVLSQKKSWANTGKTNKSSRFKLHLPHQHGNFWDILRFETSPYLDVNCRTERCSKPSKFRDFTDFTNEDVRPKWASKLWANFTRLYDFFMNHEISMGFL